MKIGNLCVTMLNEWMKTNIVLQLIDFNIFPLNFIKAALIKRFFEERKTYTSFAYLYEAVTDHRGKAN